MSMSRRKFLALGAVSAAGAFGGYQLASWMALEEVGIAYIGCGVRARHLMEQFDKVPRVNVVGLCDPDSKRLGEAQTLYPKARAASDLREVLEWSDVDAVIIATCNHWHCLASIWAMQAGKHVYVEKPLSHSQWEGQQVVLAAQKYDRLCQVGMQHRSDRMQAEIRDFLHRDQVFGGIQSVRANVVRERKPIGLRETPLTMPQEIDYDLWLGPAANEPILRESLHYDWHWNWNTGSGEMGNWGVHVLDDVRNVVFEDRVGLPDSVRGGGGRVVWSDAGETPNVQFVEFKAADIPVAFGLTNLPESPGSKERPSYTGPKGHGYVVYCESGMIHGKRGKAYAYDPDGKLVRKFEGDGGAGVHQANFIDAIRSSGQVPLNAPIKTGHHSAGWCNVANIAYLSGKPFGAEAVGDEEDGSDVWKRLLEETEQHLAHYEIPMESGQIVLSERMDIDTSAERFAGEGSEEANRLLRREYREPFVVPDLSGASPSVAIENRLHSARFDQASMPSVEHAVAVPIRSVS